MALDPTTEKKIEAWGKIVEAVVWVLGLIWLLWYTNCAS